MCHPVTGIKLRRRNRAQLSGSMEKKPKRRAWFGFVRSHGIWLGPEPRDRPGHRNWTRKTKITADSITGWLGFYLQRSWETEGETEQCLLRLQLQLQDATRTSVSAQQNKMAHAGDPHNKTPGGGSWPASRRKNKTSSYCFVHSSILLFFFSGFKAAATSNIQIKQFDEILRVKSSGLASYSKYKRNGTLTVRSSIQRRSWRKQLAVPWILQVYKGQTGGGAPPPPRSDWLSLLRSRPLIGPLLVYCDISPPSCVTCAWRHVSPYLWNGDERFFFFI